MLLIREATQTKNIVVLLELGYELCCTSQNLYDLLQPFIQTTSLVSRDQKFFWSKLTSLELIQLTRVDNLFTHFCWTELNLSV